MERKKRLKKIALWVVGLAAMFGVGFIAPQIIGNASSSEYAVKESKAAPQISIDAQGYDLSSAPDAVLGKAYRVFNATAKDN